MPSEIAGDLVATLVEDAPSTSGGKLYLIADPAAAFLAGEFPGEYGTLKVETSGNWSYSLATSLSNVQGIAGGTQVHDIFIVTTLVNGIQGLVDIVINGTNDPATFSGELGSTLDATKVDYVSGRIFVDDLDMGEKEIQPFAVREGLFGNLTIDMDGQWRYEISPSRKIAILDANKTVSDLFYVSSKDGSRVQVEISITTNTTTIGSNIAGTSLADVITGSDGDDTISALAGNDRLSGQRGNDQLDGGLGIDTALFAGTRTGYNIKRDGSLLAVEDLIGHEGNDRLIDIERIQFSDVNVAYDFDGNAAKVAKILGAVFGATSVNNQRFVGIGLSYLDGGVTYEALASLAVTAAGASTADQVVRLLYTNVVGSPPSNTSAAPFIDMLTKGMTFGALAVLAADTALNTAHINLVGLQQVGIEYI